MVRKRSQTKNNDIDLPKVINWRAYKKINMFKKSEADNPGMALVTVLLITMVMSILAIGVLGVNVSQIMYGKDRETEIKEEQLAMGTASLIQTKTVLGEDPNGLTIAETLDGQTFTTTIAALPPGTGPNQTNPYRVNILPLDTLTVSSP